MEVTVYNIEGKDTGRKINLDDSIFNIENPNDHAIYLDVKQYLAHQRQGTHKAKERGEVAYSTKKIKRQKGTGTARAGSIKSPVFVGGGRIFGPRPRKYKIKLNKKVKQLARRSALTYKVRENKIKVVEDFTFEQPKTKQVVSILNNLNLDPKTTFVVPNPDRNVILSARNLPKVKVELANTLNTYKILNSNDLVLTESSVKIIEDILKNS
jgi:large subunit ribosomal protein L4